MKITRMAPPDTATRRTPGQGSSGDDPPGYEAEWTVCAPSRYKNQVPFPLCCTQEQPAQGRTAIMIAPVNCRRCQGTGMVDTPAQHLGIPGLCMGCDGTGVVEGDRGELARIKAERERAMHFQEAEDVLYRRTADYRLTEAVNHQVCLALLGLGLLRESDPERYAKAAQSVLDQHPQVVEALAAYYVARQRGEYRQT